MLFKRKPKEEKHEKLDVFVKYADWDEVVNAIRATDYYYGWYVYFQGVIPKGLKKALEESTSKDYKIRTYVEDGVLYTHISW